jgi:hypothetical protein
MANHLASLLCYFIPTIKPATFTRFELLFGHAVVFFAPFLIPTKFAAVPKLVEQHVCHP